MLLNSERKVSGKTDTKPPNVWPVQVSNSMNGVDTDKSKNIFDAVTKFNVWFGRIK